MRGYALLCLLLLLAACGGPSEALPTQSPAPPATAEPPIRVITSDDASPEPEATATTRPSSTPSTSPSATIESEDPAGFSLTFGGNRRDRGIYLLETTDGGYAVVGYTSSFGAAGENVYLVRLDSQGRLLWSNSYGGDGTDNGWALLEMADGGFLIAGFSDSFGAGGMDFYLLRTDRDGNLQWERTYGGPADDFAWALAPAGDSGFVLAGQTESFGAGDRDAYLLKVDETGDEVWSQTYGGAAEDRVFSVDGSADDGFILTGTTRSFGAGNADNRDLYLVKADSGGALVWESTFGEAGDDVGHAVRRTSDGGYIVIGYTASFGARDYDAWLLKTDAAGVSQGQTFYGEAGDDRLLYGEQTPDGGYIATGYSNGFTAAGRFDVFVLRADPSGVVIWHRLFGGRAEDTGYTIRPVAAGGFVLTGESFSLGEGQGDMFVIKLADSGPAGP